MTFLQYKTIEQFIFCAIVFSQIKKRIVLDCYWQLVVDFLSRWLIIAVSSPYILRLFLFEVQLVRSTMESNKISIFRHMLLSKFCFPRILIEFFCWQIWHYVTYVLFNLFYMRIMCVATCFTGI